MLFIPLKMKDSGTLDSLMHIPKNMPASRYPRQSAMTKREMI